MRTIQYTVVKLLRAVKVLREYTCTLYNVQWSLPQIDIVTVRVSCDGFLARDRFTVRDTLTSCDNFTADGNFTAGG